LQFGSLQWAQVRVGLALSGAQWSLG
jgi:hypothetical protein